jgi:hypothetical protein
MYELDFCVTLAAESCRLSTFNQDTAYAGQAVTDFDVKLETARAMF